MRFDESSSREWTAIDVLRMATEVERWAPNVTEWSDRAFADRTPALARWQRLCALCTAFEITPVREAVWGGSFLEARSVAQQQALHDFLLEACRLDDLDVFGNGGFCLTTERPPRPASLRFAYGSLARYLRHAYRLLSHNDGILEGHGVPLLGAELAERTNALLQPALHLPERYAERFISPEARGFSTQALREFGWPGKSLRQVDLDWNTGDD